MEKRKSFSILFQCEDCKERFPVSQEQAPNSLKHKEEFKSNGKSIFLTYYDCPSCGRRHFVQIDDESSLQELVRVTNEFYKLAAMRKKGKNISKRQSENFKKSRQHLAEYRIKLMESYTGKSAIDKTGVEFILRFSIWK